MRVELPDDFNLKIIAIENQTVFIDCSGIVQEDTLLCVLAKTIPVIQRVYPGCRLVIQASNADQIELVIQPDNSIGFRPYSEPMLASL